MNSQGQSGQQAKLAMGSGRDEPGTDSLIEVKNVSKTYCRNLQKSLRYGVQDIWRELTFRGSYRGELRGEEFTAVDDVSFQVQKGECVALLGPNGAGKSTMLKMVNGILRPNSGSIKIRGRVGALIELGTGFNPILTGRENVFVNASVLGFSRTETEEKFENILEFSEIGEFIDAPVHTYSSGMRMRLGFSVASHLAPDLLLIDEVLAVGDLGFRLKCFEHLRMKVASGVSVILVSHIIAMIPRLCTRAIVFHQGKIAFDGEVMEGVARYQKILGLEKGRKALASSLEDDLDSPLGGEPRPQSGGLQILDARTLTTGGVEEETFQTHAGLVLELRISAGLSLADCRLVVTLQSPLSGDISILSSLKSKFLVKTDRDSESVVRMTIDDLPLVDGAYSFRVALYGENRSQLLDTQSALAPFQILNGRGKSVTRGVVEISHRWQQMQ
ncbi:ABC transporter ATP-binding protein [Pirellulaceae bacterium]|nr:ABC transporter ATP-binding protein [Pirellulaceae bacterium]